MKRFAPFSRLLLPLQAALAASAAVSALARAAGGTLSPAFWAAAILPPLLLHALLSRLPRLRVLYYPAALLAVAAVARSLAPDLPALREAFSSLPVSGAGALLPWLRPLCLLTALLFESAALTLGTQSVTGLGLAAAFLGALFGAPAPLCLAAAVVCACRTGFPRAFLPAAAALSLSLLLLPLGTKELPALREAGARMLQSLQDHLFYADPRLPFSLTAMGWQPFGAGQLGGTVSPVTDAVMEVRLTRPALLRGAIHSEYDGHAFSDPQPGQRYLFSDPRNARLRDALYDRRLPAGALRAALPAEERISVRMLAEGAGTLFVTGRFSSLSAPGLVLYHSGTGEIFATRGLLPGDSYSFLGVAMDGRDPAVARLAEAAAEGAEPPGLSGFLALPDTVEPEVFHLAETAAAGAETPCRKASRLAAWLSGAFPYSLRQNDPPADRDFVSWFLLDERRGSCTSFAAAMVVLSRACGLPARYCEGFRARPGADGTAILTGADAHAWAEVFLPGLGWTPFDATPASGSDGGGADGSAAVAPYAPDGLPDGTPAPAVPVTPVTPTEAPGSPSRTGGEARVLPFAACACLPAAAWLLLRLLRSPARRAAHARGREAAVLWYEACRRALTARGLPPEPGEAPGAYLLRADAALPGLGLSDFASALRRALYAKRGLRPGDAEAGRRAYRALARENRRRFLSVFRRERSSPRIPRKRKERPS